MHPNIFFKACFDPSLTALSKSPHDYLTYKDSVKPLIDFTGPVNLLSLTQWQVNYPNSVEALGRL